MTTPGDQPGSFVANVWPPAESPVGARAVPPADAPPAPAGPPLHRVGAGRAPAPAPARRAPGTGEIVWWGLMIASLVVLLIVLAAWEPPAVGWHPAVIPAGTP